jgi:hypothetical protein
MNPSGIQTLTKNIYGKRYAKVKLWCGRTHCLNKRPRFGEGDVVYKRKVSGTNTNKTVLYCLDCALELNMINEKEYFYAKLNHIEKAVHDAKENLDLFIKKGITPKGKLQKQIREAFDYLDTVWDELAGVLNRFDGGDLDPLFEEEE